MSIDEATFVTEEPKPLNHWIGFNRIIRQYPNGPEVVPVRSLEKGEGDANQFCYDTVSLNSN